MRIRYILSRSEFRTRLRDGTPEDRLGADLMPKKKSRVGEPGRSARPPGKPTRLDYQDASGPDEETEPSNLNPDKDIIAEIEADLDRIPPGYQAEQGGNVIKPINPCCWAPTIAPFLLHHLMMIKCRLSIARRRKKRLFPRIAPGQ